MHIRLRNIFSNMKIKRKLILFLSFIIFFVGVSSFSALQISFKVYDKQLYSDSAEIINFYSSKIESELKQIDELSFNIMSDKDIQENLKILKDKRATYESVNAVMKLKEKLLEFSMLKDYISTVKVIDTYKNEYAVGLVAYGKNPYPERMKEICSKAMELKGENAWIEPSNDDRYIISARVVRSNDFNGRLETLGILIIKIDAEKLINFCSSVLEKYRTNIAILSGNNIIFKTINDEEMKKIMLSQYDGQIYKTLNVGGTRYFLTQMTSDYTGWSYINILPYEKIYSGIVKLRIIMVILCIFISFLAIWFSIRFANSIVEPVITLSNIMKKVEIGEFIIKEENRLKSNAYDEIGQLYVDFQIMLKKINTLIEENYVKQIALKETQFKALQAQINPHFLYNTLDSINWLANVNNQKDISTMVQSLGNLMRSAINDKENIIPVSEELKLLKNYISIQKIRYEERLDFSIIADDGVLQYYIPKLILQPIIENSINYGLEAHEKTCRILVKGEVADNCVILSAIDNGPGMSAELIEKIAKGQVKPKGSGVGLRNIDERIKILYGADYGIMIKSCVNEGTEVIVKIPCRKGIDNV